MPDEVKESKTKWWQEDLGCGWVVAVFIAMWGLVQIVDLLVKK